MYKKIWCGDIGLGVATTVLPRIASTAIGATIRNFQWARTDNVCDLFPVRVAWIRHPIDRIVSSFFFFKEQNNLNFPLESYRSFVDFTFLNWNPHWCYRRETLIDNESYVPSDTHRYEQLQGKWMSYFSYKLPVLNGSIQAGHDAAYRRQELEDKYKADVDLWESAA